ncbi:hypothetical protein K9M79_06085 [Candidatus Woesearchaeota archaeon]|nr:hypothetical protein [Candidatus Woesearchaeota archaeon]
MDEKRIMEAKSNFDSYIRDGLVRKEECSQVIFDRYVQNSIESLSVSDALLEISPLWVTVSSYYSMFYIANAYLHKKGYKTQHQIVHKVVSDCLIVLARDELESRYFDEFDEEMEKSALLDNYEYERAKRASYQYETTDDIKRSKATTSLKRAKEFVKVFREMIQ